TSAIVGGNNSVLVGFLRPRLYTRWHPVLPPTVPHDADPAVLPFQPAALGPAACRAVGHLGPCPARLHRRPRRGPRPVHLCRRPGRPQDRGAPAPLPPDPERRGGAFRPLRRSQPGG